MADYGELLSLLKQASVEANEAGSPVAICFGKVTSANPLQILVDQKMTLNKNQLVLTRAVSDSKMNIGGSLNTSRYSFSHKHEILNNDGTKVEEMDTQSITNSHSHSIDMSDDDNALMLKNALRNGEEVILLRMQGGQQYIVLDRIGG